MTIDPKCTFVLIPGAGGSAFYWYRLVAELERRGRASVAVELPAGDEAAGLPEYAAAVFDAIDRITTPVVVVAQSMGGFTGPLVCTRRPAEMLVMVNAMIPLPGETPGDWWGATGQAEARQRLATEQGRVVPDDAARGLLPRRASRCVRRGDGPARTATGRRAVRPTTRHRSVARRADPRDRGSGRSVLPDRLPDPREPGPIGHHARRRPRRPPGRPESSGRIGRPSPPILRSTDLPSDPVRRGPSPREPGAAMEGSVGVSDSPRGGTCDRERFDHRRAARGDHRAEPGPDRRRARRRRGAGVVPPGHPLDVPASSPSGSGCSPVA